ncbi:SagB family peptide dehydrogenase [Streptomyces milbemycinicus]|uniref:SagB family peptide dehydrogenase n=1 Tax=Streptomyces milbemycinicus TaxID=476552 RepID=A0ABW8LMN5_9ACTN
MSPLLLSLHPGTALHDDQGLLTVRHRWGRTPLGPHTPPLAEALHTLAAGPTAVDEMADRINARAESCGLPPEPQLALFHHCLDRLGHTLQRHATHGSRPLATAVPLAPDAALRPGPVPDTPLTLDRAAHLRPVDGQLALESPRSRFRVRVEDPRTATPLALLARPASRAELGRHCHELPEGALTALLTLLHSTGFLHPANDAGRADTADLPSGWSFHELLAYDGARAGPRDRLYGPVFPLRDTEPPPPPVTRPATGRTIPLRRPDLDRAAREDRTFTDVLESRASRRTYGERPLTRDQLGKLLYRAARVRTVLAARPEDDRPYAVTSRPYPSAGSAYELELYAAVHRCQGLDRGLYHYDPLGHALTALPGTPGAVDDLLREASAATGAAPPPDVHLTLVSRIKRLSWKYAAHSYALTLKNTGVLLQTLSLVATAMGLSGCAVGGGDSETPVRAFGLAAHTEIPVGAFLLGSAAADGPDHATPPASTRRR